MMTTVVYLKDSSMFSTCVIYVFHVIQLSMFSTFYRIMCMPGLWFKFVQRKHQTYCISIVCFIVFVTLIPKNVFQFTINHFK